jgi:hypothetical protein
LSELSVDALVLSCETVRGIAGYISGDFMQGSPPFESVHMSVSRFPDFSISRFSLLLLLAARLLGQEMPYDLRLPVVVGEVPSPAAKAVTQNPALARDGEGRVVLAWIEAASAVANTLKLAAFDPEKRVWGRSASIASGETIMAQPADTRPAVAALPGGRLAVAWTVLRGVEGMVRDGNARAVVSFSKDGGVSWSPAADIDAEAGCTAFPAVASDGRGAWTFAWHDITAEGALARPGLLHAREWGSPVRALPARSLGLSALALAGFADDGALLLYRKGEDKQPRDPWSLRFGGRDPELGQCIGREGWKPAQAAAGGPRLAVAGRCAAAAWYTAADGEPRILAAASPDAGRRWTPAVRCDLGNPLGGPDLALLPDASVYVLWYEGRGYDESEPAGLYLRRYGANGGSALPHCVFKTGAEEILGVPALGILSDTNAPSVRLLAAFATAARGGGAPVLRTLLLQLPGPEALKLIDDACRCGPGS